LAKEFASRSVTVNAIAPGFIETDMTTSMDEAAQKHILTAIPLKKMGTSEDIAEMTKFLASESANYITGQVFTVDGGMVM
jgi:3-oxoacyl-[acyl-carrier protein] reductase